MMALCQGKAQPWPIVDWAGCSLSVISCERDRRVGLTMYRVQTTMRDNYYADEPQPRKTNLVSPPSPSPSPEP